MATVNFKINQTKKDLTKIYVRLREKGIDLEIPIGITINKNHWNQNKQEIKNVADADHYRIKTNTILKKLEARIFSRFNDATSVGENITQQWLKDVVSEFQNKPTSTTINAQIYLTDFAETFIEASRSRKNLKTGKPIKRRTIQDYENVNGKLKRYENLVGQKIKMDAVNIIFHTTYVKHLREKEHLGENAIGGQISIIKQFLRDAEIQEIKVHPAHRSKQFYAPSFKPKDIYFNETDIELIKNHSFIKDSNLDNARDWLIIGLWSGLRVSDLLKITKRDILKLGFIDNSNFKTDIKVKIPIHPDSQAILDKRGGEFPKSLPPQKFNTFIKDVAKEVGFIEIIDGEKMMPVVDKDGNEIHDDEGKKMYRKTNGSFHKYELVSSHICRRSFASNLYGKIDTLTIMKITGHTTEKQFLDYIKITESIHAERLADLWSKAYKNQNPD